MLVTSFNALMSKLSGSTWACESQTPEFGCADMLCLDPINLAGPVQLWYIINNIQSWLGINISAVELLERPDRVLVDFHRCTRQGSRYTNNIDVKSVVSTVSTQLNAPEPAWAGSRSERCVRRTGTRSGSRCRSWGRTRTCFQHQAWWVWKELSVLNRVWFISLTTACLL